MAFTAKQERFCEEYVIDCNATQAAIRAGYSPDTANEQASRLLANVNIQERIAELRAAISSDTGISARRVLEEYAKIAFFDIRKIYNDDGSLRNVCDFDADSAAAVCGIECVAEKTTAGEETIISGTVRKVKLNDKLRALQDVAKHIGLFEKDNQQKSALTVSLTPKETKEISEALDERV
jgi:phage terminase small subunit